jgi:hypothetical protein
MHPHHSILDDLAEEASQFGLVLFLGAGINGSHMPQWSDLLDGLLEIAFKQLIDRDTRLSETQTRESLRQWVKDNHDVYARASLAKALLGDSYESALRQAIYHAKEGAVGDIQSYREWLRGNGEQPKPPSFHYLDSIVRLCQLPAVRAVVTFNFDNLLELAMEWMAEGHLKKQVHRYPHVISTSTFRSRHRNEGEKSALPVYHVHGLVEFDARLFEEKGGKTVFSSDEYLSVFARSMEWETATPLHLLRNYCSLWLGASLVDWNMLRLLQAATSEGALPCYCLESTDSLQCKKDEIKGLAQRLRSTLLNTNGVQLIGCDEGFGALPGKIDDLIQIFEPVH